MKVILLVDDKQEMCHVFGMIVNSHSPKHIVIEAENGLDAIMMYKRYKPDLVFMDLNMPVMGGASATKIIHDMHPESNIVLVSAQADINFDTERLVKEGYANRIMTKPPELSDLYYEIDQAPEDALRMGNGGYDGDYFDDFNIDDIGDLY